MVAGVPSAARAKQTVLEPTGKWALDYGKEKCRLLRTFGTGEDQTLLYFEQFAPSDKVTFTLAGPAIRRFSKLEKIGVRWAPRDAEPFDVEVDHGKFGSFGAALIVPSLSLDSMPQGRGRLEAQQESEFETEGLPQIVVSDLAAVEWLGLSRRNSEVVLPLPGFNEAMALVDDCALDLVRFWDLDPEEHKTMTRLAEPVNLREIAERVARYYPAAAVRRREQADLNLRIIVNSDGSIEDCSVINLTITNYIKTPTCDEFGSRAMFAPAENAQGEPIKSFYTTRITYRIGN
jgi:hypothetical protein